jgi:hypothetical protein
MNASDISTQPVKKTRYSGKNARHLPVLPKCFYLYARNEI